MEVLIRMERILIIQTAFIGDAILTLPMIQKLKDFFPGSQIDVLAIPSTAEIFSSSAYVNGIIIFDKKNKDKSPLATMRLSRELQKNKYSRVYSPHRSFRTSFLVMNLGVKETYGFSNAALRHVYKNLVEYSPKHHEVQRNLDLIGFNYHDDEWRIQPQINITDISEKKVNDFFVSLNIESRIIAVAPGSVWNTKKYPHEYYEEIIKYFVGKSFCVLLIGSEAEKNVCDNIALKNAGKVFSAAGHFSLIESVELLKKAELLICNDSAPTHLGMCAGIPVLTIYCSTVPGFGFYPYNKESSFLSYDDLSCKPCGIHGKQQCPVNTFDCGLKLLPQNVISKAEGMLNDKY